MNYMTKKEQSGFALRPPGLRMREACAHPFSGPLHVTIPRQHAGFDGVDGESISIAEMPDDGLLERGKHSDDGRQNPPCGC